MRLSYFMSSFVTLFLLVGCLLMTGLVIGNLPAYASQNNFAIWLDGVKQEARSKGISNEVISAALDGTKPIERVVELDRKQPESTITFAKYKKNILSKWRISKGKAMIKQHKKALMAVSKKYGVAPQYIVALWGIETGYGNYTGGFKVVDALATLAYDPRRSDFFRKELFSALKILNEKHISAQDMKGSWAGAMGQNQFMPSSFERFAVDEDGDGRRDIWGTQVDVFASSANYLSKSGWIDGQRWGRQVRLPKDFPTNLISKNVERSLKDWQLLGVRAINGGDLPQIDGYTSYLVAPDGAEGDVYLVYNNYKTILKWNRSDYFATSVGLLADRLAQAL